MSAPVSTGPTSEVRDAPPSPIMDLAPSELTREQGTAKTSGGGLFWTAETEDTPELRWPNSVRVYDRMRTEDAQIISVLRAVQLPVLRTGWRIEQGPARDEVAEHVARDLNLPLGSQRLDDGRRTRGRFSWQQHLSEALLMTAFGHMFFEQVYRFDDARQKLHLRKLSPRMPRTLTEIGVADDGGLSFIKQSAPQRTDTRGLTLASSSDVRISVDRLVAYVHQREGGDWRGRSMLRGVYKNWLIKDRLLRTDAQSIDRNGMGVPLYKGAPNEKSLDAGLEMAKGWRAGNSSGAAVPDGADLLLRGVEGSLPNALGSVRYHDDQIARSVLAHLLNLGQQTGSWALGASFLDLLVLSLQALGESVRDVGQQHVVEDLVDVNWGEDEPAPLLVMDDVGSRHSVTAESIRLLLDSGALRPDRELEEYLRSMFGLPPKDTPPPPAPVPGGGDSEEDQTT